MNASTDSKDTTKFWTFLLIMLLAVAVAVTLIDLTIKASILAESNSMKLAMEEWEVNYGRKVSGRRDQRNTVDPADNGYLPGDVLGSGNAGMEAGNAANGAKKSPHPRARNRDQSRASDGD